MGKLTALSLIILPLALANQYVYLPVPLTYYVPSAPIQVPAGVPVSAPVLPTQYVVPTPHGNRKHEVTVPSVYHDSCDDDFTSAWQDSEAGSIANIRVKRPSAQTYSTNWVVELLFDRPIKNLDAYNADVTDVAHVKYRFTAPAWNTYASPTSNEIKFSFKADFDASQQKPKMYAYIVDGKYHTCKPKPQVATKSVRLAPSVSWPKKVMGLYVLLADDSEEGFESNADWEPELFEWQQQGSNVLFFTFIHPDTMEIPPSFQKLAASRGTDQPGAVPADTVIMFAIGGYAYSIKPNPWHWLTSREKAEKMAEKVAEWPALYGCDGIDLDLEEGAGAKREAGPNMIHFIRRLKELAPNMIVSQPVYGYPQVQAETDVINASWDTEGNSQGLADSLGLMVYEGTQALNYVKNYANGSGQWQGFPIKVNAPKSAILLGAKGSSSSSTIMKLARAAVEDDILGIMVWYASVKNGFDYAPFWDASTKADSISGYKQAMKLFNKHTAGTKDIVVVDEDIEASEAVAEPEPEVTEIVDNRIAPGGVRRG